METFKNKSPTTADELRRHAEERLKAHRKLLLTPRSEEETQRLVHELEVHQIELEMQNEELHRARQDEEAALERYTDLYDFAPIGYVTIDRHGLISAVNLGGAALLGLERSLLLGRRFSLYVADEDRIFFSGFLEKIFAGMTRESCDITLRNEEHVALIVHVDAVAFESGQECRVAIIDITGQKRIEKALRQSEECFRATFDQAAVGIGHVSTGGHWLRINRKYCELVGYTEDELTAMTIKSITHPDDLEQSMIHFQHLLDGTLENYSLETRFICKDGSIVWVNLTASMVFDDNGNPGFAACIAEDITARKNAEILIKKLNADLTARAAELETANQELETFNYSVAHDLRQPLNVISSYCQVIKELTGDALDEQCRRYLNETYEGTLRMSRLIEALLNFSRMGRIEPCRNMVELRALAHEVVTLLKHAEPERRVDFRTAGTIVANGDANLLRVVMENLLGNAWKYTGMQEAPVIEFGVTEIDGKPVYFVRDNGVGFDNADADKLFIPFQRLPGAEEFRGFGIGLATVQRIIKRHGGRVWADGTPGQGATFWFTVQ